jgi:hypothetical protein
VEVLRRDGFIHATTVEDFLANHQKFEGLSGSVIIVDESSLKSIEMGASVLRIAQGKGLSIRTSADGQPRSASMILPCMIRYRYPRHISCPK